MRIDLEVFPVSWRSNVLPQLATFCATPHMNFSFGSKKLREICEKKATAEKAIGKRGAQILQNRLADIEAADSFADVIAGSPRVDPADSGNSVILDLCDDLQISMIPMYPNFSDRKISAGDIARVTSVKIIKIGSKLK
ncbi:MAG: hypothetical protein GC202_13460 [Alphaproteobacteria bacterium]|nr:hypothetical protein [Alphaproteobacteria bacterium]